MGKKERIEKALEDLHMKYEVVFSVRDIDYISREAKVSTFDVMHYLRYERRR